MEKRKCLCPSPCPTNGWLECPISTLQEENSTLRAELAAMKAQRCAGCKSCRVHKDSAGQEYQTCGRQSSPYFDEVLPADFNCSDWQARS